MNRLTPRIGRNAGMLLMGIVLAGLSNVAISEPTDKAPSSDGERSLTQAVRPPESSGFNETAYNFQFQAKKGGTATGKNENAADQSKSGEPDAKPSTGPERTQFGMEWPALKECLQFSDEGGDWLGGSVTYHFDEDGQFQASYTTNYVNRLYRQRQRRIEFNGRWKLALREITTADQKKMNIVTKDGTKGHFLVITLTEVTVEPPFGDKEEFAKIFPSPKGGRFSKESKLFLDEVNEYMIPGTRYIGKTDPRFLHWIVLEDELGYFPQDTVIGEKAWTLVQKPDLRAPSDKEKKASSTRK